MTAFKGKQWLITVAVTTMVWGLLSVAFSQERVLAKKKDPPASTSLVQDMFNVVTDCGADGTDAADDRAAIQSCIEMAKNDGGGTVYFPSGTYKVNGTLNITSGHLVLMGTNNADTVIMGTNPSVTLLKVDNNGQVVNHTTIRDLNFQYEAPNASGTLMTFNQAWRTYLLNLNFGSTEAMYKMGSAIRAVGGNQFFVADSVFTYPVDYAIYTAQIGDVYLDNLEINLADDNTSIGAIFDSNTGGIYATNVNVTSGKTGFKFVDTIPNTPPPNYGFFTNCLADTQFGGIGWDFQSALSMVLTNSWAASAKTIGIYADQVDGLGVYDSRIYNNGEEGIYVTANAKNVTVSNSRIAGNSRLANGDHAGIYLVPAATNVMIRGNTIGESDGFLNTQSYGIQIPSGTNNGLMIEGNMLLNNVDGKISNLSTGTQQLITNNLEVNH
ncbi:hypothetical protein Back11_44050 [Paenibacillus baekrokdamisoli]|uniref:Uncharacterized protein n=1 Tax=Paenibacillus baekrokdamisoli TaxID=1712516 RepID=A0A3G9IW44_9BACL|nr:right-handed parallel beta-helix repeat-containing protein [Paenibacillus baekrokdamisoli]MBB3067892.1 hypothetical protein [Paenibacillus baekrokdamisoli]BBH23060.1 hypothetical protein Back11_44050 [Paenibacillus baekrokdamisoli]